MERGRGVEKDTSSDSRNRDSSIHCAVNYTNYKEEQLTTSCSNGYTGGGQLVIYINIKIQIQAGYRQQTEYNSNGTVGTVGYGRRDRAKEAGTGRGGRGFAVARRAEYAERARADRVPSLPV